MPFDSGYGERWFEFDRSMERLIHKENAQRQYRELLEDGEIEEGETFESWYEAGNYDLEDWGN